MKVFGTDFMASVAMATAMVPVARSDIPKTSLEVTGFPEHDDVESCATDSLRNLEIEYNGFYIAHQKFVVPDCGVELELLRMPRVVIRDFNSICIDDWGVVVTPAVEATPERMAREAVRSFLGHLRKARNGTLDAAGRRIWRNLLADFASDAYMEASAAPVKAMGVLKVMKPKYAVVSWSDEIGEDDRVDGELRDRLSFLREGDVFSATVKFIGGKLVNLENVLPCDV